MDSSIVVTPPNAAAEIPMAEPVSETTELLKQILDVQREQLALMQASSAAHDHTQRWKAFLSRWHEDFPGLAAACKQVVPILERTYASLLADLVAHLREQGEGALDNEYTLAEFLDRYGMRLGQLGAVLGLVASLAEAGTSNEPAA
ncbi:MAG: hypothetical protein NZ700_16410 [Gemmataceae bacterium]|nr:hypothetical protein [Gemmataceae bacterium]MDW8265223.1 hypothetical protein [Gemmataceae bacterium]